MVDQDQIDQWKMEYGPIYRITMGPNVFIYRTLTIAEHSRIFKSSNDDCEFEDAIVDQAVLYTNADYDTLPAKVPTELAGHILESSMLGTRISKDGPIDNTLQWQGYLEERKGKLTPRRDADTRQMVVEDPIGPLIVQVCAAFPAYTPDDLYGKRMADLLDLVALSELALGNIKADTSNRPPTMPPGLTGGQRQEFLERTAMDASTAALSEEMKKTRNAGTQS